jgi:hypothetical protein
MEIFVNRIPSQCSERDLNRFLRAPLAEFAITDFICEKFGSKPCGKLVLLDFDKGKRFLAKYGLLNGQRKPLHQLSMNGQYLNCSVSKNLPDELLLRSLKSKAAQTLALPQIRTSSDRPVEISSLRCGIWSFIDHNLTFVPHFIDSRRGKVVFGHHQAAILFNDSIDQSATRVSIKYFDIDTVTTGDFSHPTITFSLQCPPNFYREATADIVELMKYTGLLNPQLPIKPPKKKRVTSINRAHSAIVATCFVYQIQLADHRQLPEVFRLLQGNRSTATTTISRPTPTAAPSVRLASTFQQLDAILAQTSPYSMLPFDVKFQLLRLARNGALQPDQVIEILPTCILLQANHDSQTIVESLRRLYRGINLTGPHSDPLDHSITTITNNLLNYAQEYDRSKSENPHNLANRHSHIVLVHKLTVTPTAVYLEGPEPEVSNRVLRQYQTHSDYFLRATFIDEDGEPVRYDPQSNQTEIYLRFRTFMESEYFIAGRGYSFLGFSNSSLRSHTCWFMAPFISEGELLNAPELIKGLGDFGHIRSPARCAARIGQAFSDTTGTVQVEAGMLVRVPDVERNGRCFSDGCGTISIDLLRKVWRVYGVQRSLKPCVLQIRFAGAKGVVSLDHSLTDEQFRIRPSMEKFTGSLATTLEVCGAAWRPYPMVLNRQFIKILEGLQVPPEPFMILQDKAVEKLRMMTTNTFNAAFLLKDTQTSKAAKLSDLLDMLADIGLEYHGDVFLRSIVDMAVSMKLRDIKYRGRIPVEHGITLYGIMDETGFLKEDQIYVTVQSSVEEAKKVLTGGKVIITRSPALHPGDIRTVEAIDVPEDSPLDKLRNCVVFSQHGHRDLPSKLSGGDLDGDLYNVIFDSTLMPRRDIAAPADYPRVPDNELDREVTVRDMSNFFVQFMETDQLGQICSRHLQVADQKPMGVFDQDCIKLADMASRAVDFSKTGIPVSLIFFDLHLYQTNEQR